MKDTSRVHLDQTDKKSICPVVARKEWVAFPEVLHGAFLRTSALRLLRCVYGSDQASLAAVQEHLAVMREMHRKAGADA